MELSMSITETMQAGLGLTPEQTIMFAERLTPREGKVIAARAYGKPIAKELGITIAHMQYIEARAWRKIMHSVKTGYLMPDGLKAHFQKGVE